MVSKEFMNLLDKMKIMHIQKNAGYSGMDNPDAWANFRLSENFGVSPFIGCMIRMSDKFSRVQSLIKNTDNEQVGEKLSDTLLDMASYCLIAVCLLYEQEEKDKMSLKSRIYEAALQTARASDILDMTKRK